MRFSNAPRTREFLLIAGKGEKLPGALLDWARRHAVGAASFHAVGAFRDATIAYWNAATKEYEEIPVREQVEVISMTGNIMPSREDLKLHAHTTLGKRDGSTIGGHFVRGVVFPTLEIWLSEHVTSVQRKKDEETGLWLLDV